MKLPSIKGRSPAQDRLTQWKGLNLTDGAGKGEFSYMENMSSDRFPLLSPRKPRERVRQMAKANGFCLREKLLYVDGTQLFYGAEKIGTVTDSPKTFVSMGAYVYIFPDKLEFHTATGALVPMEASFSAKGIRYEASGLLEDEGSMYVKLMAEGIDTPFQKGDAIAISGFGKAELDGYHVIQETGAGYLKIIAALEGSGSTAQTVTLRRHLPACDFWTAADNRLWGCSSENHEIYASKLGDAKNFYAYDGTAGAAYAATVAGDGDFTGAITYLGHVMFFKENSVHKIYGSKPSDFQVMEGRLRGVARGSERSLCIVNEVLYYLSPEGVMSFQGSLPYAVGDVLGKGFTKGVAGTVGDKYYISMEQAGAYSLFVYDTAKGLWHREDATAVTAFQKDGARLYYLAENTLWLTEGTAAEQVEWLAETTPFTYQTPKAKAISRITLRAELPYGSSLSLWVDYDSLGAWQPVQTVTPPVGGSITIPFLPAPCDHFRLRFGGCGRAAIHEMTLFLRERGEGRRWQR